MPQTNVKTGPIKHTCAVDLTNAADRLVKLGINGMFIPGYDDPVHYLVLEGAAAGEQGSFLPLSTTQNVRVPLEGTCQPGNALLLSSASPGAVKVPDAETEYFEIAIAEEAGVDGQLVLVRPIAPRFVAG